MKINSIKNIVAVVAAVVAVSSASAQAYLEDPRYGNSPEERKENVMTLNSFNDYVTTKDYDNALKQLNVLLEKAPKATVNLYIRGAMIYKNKIQRATSLDVKNAYVDSLMHLYELRCANFADYQNKGRDMGAGYTTQIMATEYAKFRAADSEGIRNYYLKAMAENNYEVPSAFALNFFNELVEDYKNDEIEADLLLSEYGKIENIVAAAPQEEKDSFEALFASSGAANCDNLEAMYKDKFAANPDDAEMIGKAYALMSRAGCTGDLFISIAEKNYALAPSADIAIRLASIFENRKEYDRALKYLNESLATETDPNAKANLYVRVAASELGANRASAAGAAAREAIALNAENGYAYLMLAQAYVSSASNCSGISGQAVYWVVTDVLGKARALFADDQAQISSIDSQIATYRAHFPSNEECFFNGLSEGQSYTVKCGWINAGTIVRPRK
ncbi:MAG: enzyme of heme biosynthesis [Rikenellaceae bacterium]|nr:enzyme of heme biosynthesis [Rikenellaceae bacterium]